MPLLSILIPTHDRAKYAISSIESILSIDEDIEVIVSDTSSDNSLQEYFCTSSNNLKIIKPGIGLSVVDNFNSALAFATGDYLVFIGDDDFVTDDILKVAKWAKDVMADSVKFTFPVNYYWPDFYHRNNGAYLAGSLKVEKYTGDVKKHDPILALNECINDFGRGVLDMPRAYSGMISKALVERIILKYGRLFGGVSPDIYSSTLIAVETRSSYQIDYPIVVPGSSGASTAGHSASGKHTGELRDNKHIGAFRNLIWDPRIPEFYSVPTVWAFSFLKALDVIGIKESQIPFCRLYIRCLIYYRQYLPKTSVSLSWYIKKFGYLRFVFGLTYALVKESYWVIKTLVKRARYKVKNNEVTSIKKIDNVFLAKNKLSEYIKENDISLNIKSS